MTVQERLRQRFKVGFSSLDEEMQRTLSSLVPRFCDSLQTCASANRLVADGRLLDAFALLSPSRQLEFVDYVENLACLSPDQIARVLRERASSMRSQGEDATPGR